MKDSYGVIPYPKLDGTQKNHMTLIHDGTHMFGIPLANSKSDVDISCAVLEAMCAENYRTVTPAYYEIALKVKYTHDDISMQLIDMIHENIRTDFIYANNYGLSASGSIGTIARKLMSAKSADYMSTYDSMKTQVEQQLKEMAAKIN